MIKRILPIIILIHFCLFSFAQDFTKSTSAIFNDVLKLRQAGTVLYVAAHPDDENTRLLSYLAGQAGLRTCYLSMTRGDGGQNLLGKELGEELGMIRTQELLAARKIDGAEQYFTSAIDFGYSKSPEETLEMWGHDAILHDVVKEIRELKPDLIICRFPTTGEGGHGHHTASAILAGEAFAAAGDATKYPVLANRYGTWRPRALFWNTFNFGGNNTTSEDQLKLDIGVVNGLSGKGYGEIASLSRSMHKSQGFGSAISRGTNIEYFKFLEGERPEFSLLEGYDLSWKRFGPEGQKIEKAVNGVIQNFSFTLPAANLNNLMILRRALESAPNIEPLFKHYVDYTLAQLDKIIFACSGLVVEYNAAVENATQGDSIRTTLNIIAGLTTGITLEKIHFHGRSDSTLNQVLTMNELYAFPGNLWIDQPAQNSSPVWLQKKPGKARFNMDEKWIGQPVGDALYYATLDFRLLNSEFSINVPMQYKYTDPTRGEVHQPFYILPPIEATEFPPYLWKKNGQATFSIKVKSNVDNFVGELLVGSPSTIGGKKYPINISKAGQALSIEINLPESMLIAGSPHFTVKPANKPSFDLMQVTRIHYDHIPNQVLLRPVSIHLINAEVNIGKNNHILYVNGAGDDVAAGLKEVGYSVDIIDPISVANTDLNQYGAIILGIRVYNVFPDLFNVRNKLMDYVKRGGNLITQYNTSTRWKPIGGEIGPYPLEISRDRVTEEDAKVKFIETKDPALNTPNAITEADFDGWVQERGTYFATERDKKYRAVLSMHDRNEKPMDGSLVIGKYGKGNFVYAGIAFFRQIPAGVPGAYRLLANLINLPPNG